MRPGQLVIHKPTGRRLTVKATGGGAMVLCCWMDRDAGGKPVECSAAFDWKDLRYPTAEEQANLPPADEPEELQTVGAGDVGQAAAGTASAPKRSRSRQKAAT